MNNQLVINKKKVYRLCEHMEVLRPQGESKHLVQITQEALMKRLLFIKPRDQKPIIRSDNGPQFISHYDLSPYEYIDALKRKLQHRIRY